MAENCTVRGLAALFRAASIRYERGLEELCALDAIAGDGDLGISLNAGFKAATGVLESEPEGDLRTRLRLAAFAFNRVAPSTLGTLTTAALLASAEAAAETSTRHLGMQSTMLTAGLNAMMVHGKANLGDKTVLDALWPACTAFADAAISGVSMADAVATARLAAQRGVEATKGMVPKAGRARWTPERSIGHPDAGATAVVWFFEAWEGILP